jgi:hypothetical protein
MAAIAILAGILATAGMMDNPVPTSMIAPKHTKATLTHLKYMLMIQIINFGTKLVLLHQIAMQRARQVCILILVIGWGGVLLILILIMITNIQETA